MKQLPSVEQCTLPLCKECEQIHLDEHIKNNIYGTIITFTQAYNNAVVQLQRYISSYKIDRDTYLQNLRESKQKIVAIINEYFDQHMRKVQKNDQIIKFKEKLNKIKKGSLKTLIYFYSEDHPLKKQYIQKNVCDIIKSVVKQLQQETNISLKASDLNSNKQNQQQFKDRQKVTKKSSIFKNQHHKRQQQVNNEQNKIQAISAIKVNANRLNNLRQDSNEFYNLVKKGDENYQQAPISFENRYNNNNYENIQNQFKGQIFESNKIEPLKATDLEPNYKIMEGNSNNGRYDNNHCHYENKSHQYKNNGRQQNNTRYCYNNSRHEENNHYNNNQNIINKQNQTTKDENRHEKLKSYSQTTITNNEQLNFKKKILSPQEIRRILEKRIQERSRLIYQQQKNQGKSCQRNFNHNYWKNSSKDNQIIDGKASIINQISNELKY